MKNKHLVMLLLSSCCLAACVDSKYDLSDVNTDDAVMGAHPINQGENSLIL